jgi:hypothetical protein
MTWSAACPWCESTDLEERTAVECFDGEEIHFTHRCRGCSHDLIITPPDSERELQVTEIERFLGVVPSAARKDGP